MVNRPAIGKRSIADRQASGHSAFHLLEFGSTCGAPARYHQAESSARGPFETWRRARLAHEPQSPNRPFRRRGQGSSLGPLDRRACGRGSRRLVADIVDGADRRRIIIDLAGVERLDTLGAWVLDRTRHELGEKGLSCRFRQGEPGAAHPPRRGRLPGLPGSRPRRCTRRFVEFLVDVGKSVAGAGRDLVGGIGVPRRIRRRSAARSRTAEALPRHGGRQPARADRLSRGADHRPDLVPRRLHRRPAGHFPAREVRRDGVRHRPHRHPRPARTGGAPRPRSWSPAARARPSRPRSGP